MSMVIRVFSALILATSALLAANCSSDETTVGLAEGCHINSDCNNPLSCTFGKCHKACESTRDCQPGEHCLKLAEGNVCQQAAETNCTFTSQCPVPLKCAVDSKCRVECQEARDCLTRPEMRVDGVRGSRRDRPKDDGSPSLEPR